MEGFEEADWKEEKRERSMGSVQPFSFLGLFMRRVVMPEGVVVVITRGSFGGLEVEKGRRRDRDGEE